MSEFIVLTLEQCDKLFPIDPRTGSRMRLSEKGHAICPIPLEGDLEFILPVEVLDDPKHAETLKMLAAQPFDAKAIDALPVDEKPALVDARDAVDLKAPERKRVVTEAEFKKFAIEIDPRLEQPVDPKDAGEIKGDK
jgi:hypothetical protein